jgi:deoxyribodipyrimidine photo-lyase
MKNTLYWVTNDLRINDNHALELASKSESLICVYIIDSTWLKSDSFQCKPLGDKRNDFIKTCLYDFNQSLNTMGQQLYIVVGDTYSSLLKLCEEFDITDLIVTRVPGTYENMTVTQLIKHQPTLSVHSIEQFTLFSEHSLPFELNELPSSYSKFRNKVIDISVDEACKAPSALPNKFKHQPTSVSLEPSGMMPFIDSNRPTQIFMGGEQHALSHLNQYFSSDLPAHYKDVRNKLDGWSNSSKLSAWLNQGCLSVKQVHDSIVRFEKQHGRNNSTEHLHFEILWREYFQWLHYKFGSKFYQFKGLYNQSPLTSFYPERFKKWCLGQTPYPLVNACMNELRETGYLSNRGRQIVASCLVNELSVDWRFGAAWFEEHLIDYDAAINWGNWQYIAGVGVDPRGGRHFNLSKQTQIHDPLAEYQQKWLITDRKHKTLPLDSVDASDWPITVESE